MPIDPSIPLSVKQPQFEDPSNALMKILQIQGLQDARTKEQRALDQETALNDSYRGALGADGSVDQNALLRALADRGQGSKIPAVQKSLLENDQTRSVTAKNTAEAGKNNAETENNIIGQYRNMVDSVQDPQSAVSFVTHMHQDPRLANSAVARAPLDQILAQIPQDASQIPAWKQQFALGATKFMELNKPQFITSNTGGKTVTTGVAGLTGQTTPVQTLTNTVSPDSQLSSDTSIKTTGMNNATSVKTTGMNNATSTANNRATISAENVRAGINADGTPTGDMETTAQAIASGQLPPPSGMALTNPRNQRILARVMEINPQYDFTSVTAKKKAASDFTSGPQGNAMRSFQVAGQHLDQLGQLADALGNGNLQIVNKIGNMYATQTGNPAPTNFDAAKDVVSKEVVKAIVAGGGGQAERQELSNLMSQAKSPAQLKGVIQQYRNLMAAQHDALLQQRRAAGLSDSTLPDYSEAGGGGTAGTALPPDIAHILQKHGGK